MSNTTPNTPENAKNAKQGATKMKKKIDTAAAVNHWTAKKSWRQIFRDSGYAYRTEITDGGFKFTLHDQNDPENVYGVAEDVYFGETSRWMDNLSDHMQDLLNTNGMSSVDKQKFVSESRFQGDYQEMLKKEIIPFYESHLENIEAEESEDVENVEGETEDVENVEDETEDVENVEDATYENAENVEDEEPKEETKEEEKARKALERWHGILNAIHDKYVLYITEEGSHAWASVEAPLVVKMGSGPDFVRRVLHIKGDNSLPLRDFEAKAAAGKVFMDLEDAVMRGEVEAVKKANRFHADRETGATYVYTANRDIANTPSCLKITSEGITRTDAPEGVVFENNSSGFGEIVIDESGTIQDFWNSLEMINIPKEDRMMALGWLIAPLNNPYSDRPGILLRGAKGSGKSGSAARLKELIDPDSGETKETAAPTGSKKEFMDSLVGCDTKIPGNLSGIGGTLSDAMAQSATGVLYERGEKYTENTLKWQMRVSFIFSTINMNMVMRDDLQSRLFSIDAPVLPPSVRAQGDIVKKKWRENLPKARYGLMVLVSRVKAILEKYGTELEVNGFRMIEAAKAMSAAEIVLEEEGIEFTPWGQRYGDTSAALQKDALPAEIDFILNDLRRPIEGRPGEILKALYEEAEKDGFSTSGWMLKSARGLTARLEENLDLLSTRLDIEKKPVPGRTSVTWHITPSLTEEEEEALQNEDEFYEDIF